MKYRECKIQGRWIPERLVKQAFHGPSVNKRRIAQNDLRNRYGLKFPISVTEIREVTEETNSNERHTFLSRV